MRPLSYVPFCLGISLAACGAAADDDAARTAGASAEAYKGGASMQPGVVDVSTAQQALTALTGNVDVSAGGFKYGSAANSGNGAGAPESVNVRCAGGGGANVDGYMDMVPAPMAIDVNLTIAFSGCATPNGTLIDGNVDFSQALASGRDSTSPFRVETTYVGDVNLSGNVNVSCPVDLNVLVDEHGRALQVQGTFCNQDASSLAMQLQPLWENQ